MSSPQSLSGFTAIFLAVSLACQSRCIDHDLSTSHWGWLYNGKCQEIDLKIKGYADVQKTLLAAHACEFPQKPCRYLYKLILGLRVSCRCTGGAS